MKILRWSSVVTICAAFACAAFAFGQIAPRGEEPLPPIDIGRAATPVATPDAFVRDAQQSALQELARRIPGLQLDWNPRTGTPRRVFASGGFLTEASQGASQVSAPALLQAFLRDNLAVFGITEADLATLTVVRDSSAPGSDALADRAAPLQHVTLDQRWQGRQVYPATVTGTVRADGGRLLSVAGELVPDLAAAVNATEPDLTPVEAAARAAESIGADFDAARHPVIEPPTEGDSERRQTLAAGSDFAADVPVRLIYFLVARDDVRLAWEVTATAAGDPFMYQVLVDARSGEILLRENLTAADAPRYRVYSEVLNTPTSDPKDDYRPSDNPAPLSPGPATPDGSQGAPVSSTVIAIDGDPVASPGGWLPDGTLVTAGNNVVAFVDLNGNGAPDAGEQPTAALVDVGGVQTRAFDVAADFGAEPSSAANRQAATINTFFLANWWHDRLERLGFDESAGNFQMDNGGAGGVDGDPMRARLQVGTDNSTFGTPAADGTCCPTLNAYTWTGPTPDRDSGFDAEVLVHEFAHGLTNRVIGGPNVNGLGGAGQPRGLGEGYSDSYAWLLLRQPGEDPAGPYVVGGYVTLEFVANPAGWDDNYYFGIRHFPYSTDPCVNPFTLIDMQSATYDITPPADAGCSATPPVSPWLETASGRVHDTGEIWSLALWEVRANLVAAHGFEIGNELALQLLTDSLFLLARNPTFIEARDALLGADVARTGGENGCRIWRGFAKRGFGVAAQTPTSGSFSEDFAAPEDCAAEPEPPGDGEASAFGYAAKLVCGVQEDPDELRLAAGSYATTINVHNPGPETVTFEKRLALTFPPGRQEPGEVVRIAEDALEPGEALAVDCPDVAERVFGGSFPAPYVEGFVTLHADGSLDVVAVYSSADLDGRHSGIDVEPVPERRSDERDGDEGGDEGGGDERDGAVAESNASGAERPGR